MSSKFGAETVPMFTALKLALPGIDVTYYGSEIGMEDNMYLRPEQITDTNLAGGPKVTRPRDYERCPMQWDDSNNAGIRVILCIIKIIISFVSTSQLQT